MSTITKLLIFFIFGILSATAVLAVPACSDNFDNDNDGYCDYDGCSEMMPDPQCSGPSDNDEYPQDNGPIEQCRDGIDNDGDGATDFPADFSCSSAVDNDEAHPYAACQDNFDNDNDGFCDYDGCLGLPPDPRCSNFQDNDEYPQDNPPLEQCRDGIDNDGDGAVDFPADFSCSSAVDNDEAYPYAACEDNFDNDNDGFCDYDGCSGMPPDPRCTSYQDNDEYPQDNPPLEQCRDGIDNDGDGAVDYPADYSCSSSVDNDESYPKAQCEDNFDNDNDGFCDFDGCAGMPADPRCSSYQDNDEYPQDNPPLEQCRDGIDNDGDGAVDYPADYSCSSSVDNDESYPKAQCQDDIDNDNDGFCDYDGCSGMPPDPRCTSYQDNDEWPQDNGPIEQCRDGIDNDGDGAIDYPADYSCSSLVDNDESTPRAQCQDDIDNDNDGFCDFDGCAGMPADPRCSSYQDNDEYPQDNPPLEQCRDGIDNDGDGAVDYPADYSCSSSVDNDESNPKAQCQDDIDNDNDGFCDYDGCLGLPPDPRCSSYQDNDEFPRDDLPVEQCRDGIDNDADGAIDYPADFSCSSATDTDETYPKAQCQDDIDNDQDGFCDYDGCGGMPADPGCVSFQDNSELPYDGCIDTDGDGVCDSNDNCPYAYNPGQEDSDYDTLGDACDICPMDDENDYDGDGICGNDDNCRYTYNPSQEDTDYDGVGDYCDMCPNDPQNDADGDGYCSDNDNCPLVFNPGQEDSDHDGIGDACDYGNTLTIDVKNVNTHQPISGADVTFRGMVYTTSPSGSVVITNVAPGTYAYIVTHDDYYPLFGDITMPGHDFGVVVYMTPLPPINHAPIIISTPVTEGQVSLLYTYDVDAIDYDNDTLNYYLLLAPGGMSINSITGLVQWTPSQSGTYQVGVGVSDGNGGSDTQYFSIIVGGTANHDPIITSTPILNGQVGTLYSYDVEAYDPDGDFINYSLPVKPVGMSINTMTGIIQWIPSASQEGLNAVTVLVMDTHGGYDTQSYTIDVSETVNHPPVADFTYTPLHPIAGEVVQFTSTSYDPDGDTLYYLWDLDGDGTIDSTQQNPQGIYPTPGTYYVTLNVSDTIHQSSITKQLNIQNNGTIIVDSLDCFETVIVDHEQSCSVFVSDDQGQVTGNAHVTIRYLDGTLFGTCITNPLSGGCQVIHVEHNLGIYTVYATAEKTGYESDGDEQPQFTYEVIAQRYDIMNLHVYNDSLFSHQDYDFYRGEDMYVSFQVYDQFLGGFVHDIVTAAELVSPPGGVAVLSEVGGIGEPATYYYSLTPIPPTHDFLGESQAFAFAFDYTDHTGGQEYVNLTIRNNPPYIQPQIPSLTTPHDVILTFNLEPYGHDLEDPSSILTWAVSGGSQGKFVASINGGRTLRIVPLAPGNDSITLHVYDLDGDHVSQTVTVSITPQDHEPPFIVVVHPINNSVFHYGDVPLNVSLNEVGTCIYTLNGKPALTLFTLGTYGSAIMQSQEGENVVDIRCSDLRDNEAGITVHYFVHTNIPRPEEPFVPTPDESLRVDNIHFLKGEVYSPGETLDFVLKFDNDGDMDLDNIKVVAMVPELGMRRAVGPLKLTENEKESRMISLEIPDDAAPGMYWARFTIGDGTLNRIKHRPFWIR